MNKYTDLTSSFVANQTKGSCIDDYLIHISQVSGLRFQPIISLMNESIIAQEVLSSVSGDPASFFSSIPEDLQLSIFLWQLDQIKNMSEKYWLNLSAVVLSEPYLIGEFIAWGPARENVSIEFQDPESIRSMDTLQFSRLRSGIRRLQQHGWSIILDDLTSECAPYIKPQEFQFSAVKFDRSQLRNNPDLEEQINNAQSLASFIVVEGIETAEDLKIAKSCNSNAGQGFLWPEVKLKCYVPEIVARRASLWKNRLDKIRKQRVSVNISIDNNYFSLAVTELLCDIDLTEPDGMINFVDIPHKAELNIIFTENGPICLSCQRYQERWGTEFTRFILAFIDQEKQPLNKLSCINKVIPMQLPVKKIQQLLSSSIHSLYRKKCGSEGTQRSACSKCRITTLTANELYVMHLTGSGCIPFVIAKRLGCTAKVVSKYRRNAMHKLGMSRSTDFIRMSRIFFWQR